jgi:DNA-binding winged helix-turn-helix (wHTH) protein
VRVSQNSDRTFDFDEFRLHLDDRLLLRRGEIVHAPPKAIDTLVVLVEHAGRIVSKEELMEAVWPDAFVEENNLNQAISALRKALGQGAGGPVYIETVTKRGYRFVAPGAPSIAPLPPDAPGEPPPAGGALGLESRFYVVRPADEELQTALARGDSVVLVKGARQMGKTSLLARGLQRAREAGARVALSDLQDLSSSDLASTESLFVTLGKALAEQLDLDEGPRATWDADDSPNTNFNRFLRRVVLAGDRRVVWALDEVDRLFSFPYASEVFGLFRAWHNRRALDPSGPWRRLTLAMAYATEASLFITDVNQSPFNVGTRLALDDFTPAQVWVLNERYGAPLRDEKELGVFVALVGGQPFLTQGGLHALAGGVELDDFLTLAPSPEGPFAEHLQRMYLLLSRDERLRDAVLDVIGGKAQPSEESFQRLRSAGILLGDTAYDARPRCLLYSIYFERTLARG